MTIVKREGLGRPMTWGELDGNFDAVEALRTEAAQSVAQSGANANASAASAGVAETARDEALEAAAQVENDLVRVIKAPEGEVLGELPVTGDRRDTLLGFGSNGQPIVYPVTRFDETNVSELWTRSLGEAGYSFLGFYKAGVTLSTETDAIVHDGIPFKLNESSSVGFVTTGDFNVDVSSFVQIDRLLRNDLSYLDGFSNIGGVDGEYDSVMNMITSEINAGNSINCKGYSSSVDGGGARWSRNEDMDGGSYTGKPVFLSGNIVIFSPKGKCYVMDIPHLTKTIDLRQLGANESEYIDYHYSLAKSYREAGAINKIIIYGNYEHEKPIVLPAGTVLDFIDYLKSSITKVTNNTSGLPSLTGSYGGNLIMDVDASIILDHGYGHEVDNFNIQCSAENGVEHAIYHGFTRESFIGMSVGRIGKSGSLAKNKHVHGVTAQQGFFHNYGNITCFSQNGTWNYPLNTAGTGCNVIKIRQSWNYDSTETAIKFQGATNISLGQQYCEGTKQRIYELFGCTGVSIDILTIDRHEANQIASTMYTRNSQVTMNAWTVNGITVAEGAQAKLIEHTVGAGIYGCLTINGVTARTNQINTANLITVTKDNGGVGNNCVIRGVPIPPIGALGNIAVTDNGMVSHESDTGIVTTPHNKSVINSFGSQASSNRSSVINGFNCQAAHENSLVLGTLTKSGEAFEICAGYGGTSSGAPLSSNRKISISQTTGNIKTVGTVTQGSTFADYAEYFENEQIGIIPLGTIVDLIGDKVKPANGDDFIGVISGTAGVALNSASLSWGGKYLSGSYGEPIFECIDGVKIRQENPDYDPKIIQVGIDNDGSPSFDVSYVTREERPEEWSCVGMVGQIFVNVKSDVKSGDWLTANDGIGVRSEIKTRLRVMKITSANIAKCLII